MDPQRRLVSDHEREAAAQWLRRGLVDGLLDVHEYDRRVGLAFRARTLADLDALTADFPPEPPAPTPVRSGEQPVRRVVGVLGTSRRQGRWQPARPVTAVAFLGGVVVDLSDVDVPDDEPDEIEVDAWAVLGSVEVLVPEGVSVTLGGTAVLGAKRFEVRSAPSAPGAPTVVVRARAFLGGVGVRSHRFRRGIGRRSGGPR